MMATDMAVGFGHQGMTAVNNFGHSFPLHSHHQMVGYDYYTNPARSYQDHVMMVAQHNQQHEEVDEEDIEDEDDDEEEDELEESDNESMYTSADMDSEVASDDLAEPEPNVAEQLLEFAQAVNRDIQKYFGRNQSAHEPETSALATVYEDRFASGKSGRELYYADLLRVAQNGDAAEPSYSTGRGIGRRHGASISPRTSTTSAGENSDVINANYSCQKGLGPLKELFDFAIGGCADSVSSNDHRDGRWPPQKDSAQKCFQTLPWRKRALPSSFFVEPGSRGQPHTDSIGYDPHVTMIEEHETPDFSDLVANFTAD